MAFCTRCGRQIPDGAVCDCAQQPQYQPYPNQQPYAPQQPQYQQYQQYPQQPGMPYYAPQYRQPSAFGMAMRGLPRLWGRYLKSPMGASRQVAERRDAASGWIMMAFMFLLTFLSAMFLALRWVDRFGKFAAQWCVTGLVSPICAFILTVGTVYIVAAVARRRVDFKALIGVVGINSLLPMILVFLNTLFGLIDPVLFELFTYLTIATWALTTVAVIREVFEIKLDGAALYVLALCLVASYIVISLLLHWYLIDGGSRLVEIVINLL